MKPAIHPDPQRRPTFLWLASYPKSGSTWVRLFIEAYFRGEVDINNALGIGDMAPKYYEGIIPLNELGESECFHIRSSALFKMNAEGEDKIVKTHCCNGEVHGVELIPRAFTRGAIYVIRDPRDVAISYADHTGKTIDQAIEMMGNPNLMAKDGNLYQYVSTWSAHVWSWVAGQPYIVLAVKYEDLLQGKAFDHIARLISVDVDGAKVRRAIEATRFDLLRGQEDRSGFVERSEHQEKFFRRGGSHWREILTKDQVKRIEADHGEVMKKLGYL